MALYNTNVYITVYILPSVICIVLYSIIFYQALLSASISSTLRNAFTTLAPQPIRTKQVKGRFPTHLHRFSFCFKCLMGGQISSQGVIYLEVETPPITENSQKPDHCQHKYFLKIGQVISKILQWQHIKLPFLIFLLQIILVLECSCLKCLILSLDQFIMLRLRYN